MPSIVRTLETALYVDDLDRAVAFYRDILGLRVIEASARLKALDAGRGTVLLLFQRGASTDGVTLAEGWIPPHDGSGPAHIAFAIDAGELADWERRLAE